MSGDANEARSPVWEADVHIAADLAARCIARQFPHLVPVRLEPFGVGWDNAAYLVNDAWVFRFPRRRMGVPLLECEIALLPLIADRVPLEVPRPEYVGRPDTHYACPFAGYRLLSGTTACSASLTEDERAAAAVPLGTFLRALHALDLEQPAGLQTAGDLYPKTDLARNAAAALGSLEAASGSLPPADLGRVRAGIERLAGTPPWDAEPRWLHGDLYARHLLVDGALRLCGVLDWGDVHRSDPALDLSIAFSFLPAPARDAFREAYGEIDPNTWDRARFRALFYGARLLEYGLAESDAAIVDVARTALAHAV